MARGSGDTPLACAAAALLLAGSLGLTESLAWIGKPFPGFLVLANRVVASAALPSWSATSGGDIYQHEVVSVDGVPLESATALHRLVRSQPVGTPLTYGFRQGDRQFERTIPTQRFEASDFACLFGTYLLNGVALGGAALVIRRLRRRQPAANAAIPLLMVGALWGLSAMDLYGPYRIFRLHALCEVLLFATALHMALAFPRPGPLARRHPRIVWVPYALALGLALPYQVGLYDAARYVTLHLIATSALGAALLVLLAAQVGRFLKGRLSRMGPHPQARALALGALAALALPVCLTIAEPLTGGRAPQNAVAFTSFLFPLSIGYAMLRRRPRTPSPRGGFTAGPTRRLQNPSRPLSLSLKRFRGSGRIIVGEGRLGVSATSTDPLLSARPDAEIDRLWLRRHPDALAQAYQRYRARLEAVAYRIVGDRADAEDVVQRVFISLQTATTYRGTASLWTYLYRAAVNGSVNVLRARRRRASLENEHYRQLLVSDAPRERAADAQVLEGEVLAAVARAMLRVRPQHRRVLNLRIVWNLSNTEIAEREGVPLATVGTWLRRGREELRDHLQPLLRDLGRES